MKTINVQKINVDRKSQAGNIGVKDINATARDLKNSRILLENSAEDPGSRSEHSCGYISLHENTPKKLLSPPPKNCRNFT